MLIGTMYAKLPKWRETDRIDSLDLNNGSKQESRVRVSHRCEAGAVAAMRKGIKESRKYMVDGGISTGQSRAHAESRTSSLHLVCGLLVELYTHSSKPFNNNSSSHKRKS
jgi:hypothetical protein